MIQKRMMIGLVIALVLLSFASGVWAQPDQSGLRMTVPTRTPTKVVAPPTTAPTEVPAQATAVPEPTEKPKKKSSNPQPTQVPTQAPTESVAVVAAGTATAAAIAPTVDPTAAVITEAGYPESGADYASVVVSVGALGVIAIIATIIGMRRRLKARR